ncbi:MAG: Gx transporter family protein [Ruminococcaceae bacterium]|nr:Gx transporter family protein [Oscillospiraceae bacterium]
MMRKQAHKVAFLGLCTAVAMVFAWVESLLPPLIAAVPGIKLGLPNIAIIFILYRFGVKEAAAVSLTRIIAVSLLFGNPMTMAYSLAGGFLSLTVMAVLRKWNILSIVGVSVAGGVLHNVGQILMAMLLLDTAELGYYMIVLAVTGTVSGVFIGLCGGFAVKRIHTKKM